MLTIVSYAYIIHYMFIDTSVHVLKKITFYTIKLQYKVKIFLRSYVHVKPSFPSFELVYLFLLLHSLQPASGKNMPSFMILNRSY